MSLELRLRSAPVLLVLLVLAALIAPPRPARAQEAGITADAEAEYQRLHKALSASVAVKVASFAGEVAPKTTTSTADALHAASKLKLAVLGSMPDADIEALAFLVLMQAAKSAQEDVRAIMASVKAINNAKSQQRAALQPLQKEAASRGAPEPAAVKPKKKLVKKKTPVLALEYPVPPEPPAPVDAKPMKTPELLSAIAERKGLVAALEQHAEEQQLKMQMVMERMSKVGALVSGLAKKAASADASRIAKLK